MSGKIVRASRGRQLPQNFEGNRFHREWLLFYLETFTSSARRVVVPYVVSTTASVATRRESLNREATAQKEVSPE